MWRIAQYFLSFLQLVDPKLENRLTHALMQSFKGLRQHPFAVLDRQALMRKHKFLAVNDTPRCHTIGGIRLYHLLPAPEGDCIVSHSLLVLPSLGDVLRNYFPLAGPEFLVPHSEHNRELLVCASVKRCCCLDIAFVPVHPKVLDIQLL